MQLVLAVLCGLSATAKVTRSVVWLGPGELMGDTWPG